ncbi:nitroreductase [Hypoxylon rubiginosum]|uniref:Nitroreductase n=1 Tax=Hypoxylon rubiginosum TaxID=110542 RepID=A0ACB9ZBV2_9PEZI|nr:nitroreductase [Hypoxylon rubiginosum]
MTDLSPLLEARYGTAAAPPAAAPIAAANPTLETLLRHKSTRAFLQAPLPPGTLELLAAAAQSAATSSNLQTWSAVAVTSPPLKSEAAVLCGDQEFIRAAPLFLVFCADLARLGAAADRHGMPPGDGLAFFEMYTMAAVDASLAAQNACVAAEALGLGACYVGAARNRPRELAALLGLPPRVVALFGLAVGRPDPAAGAGAAVKPRLAQDEVVHRETWGSNGEGDGGVEQRQAANLAAYDEALAEFNTQQGRGDAPTWTYRSAHRIATVESLHGRDILRQVMEERGFELR